MKKIIIAKIRNNNPKSRALKQRAEGFLFPTQLYFHNNEFSDQLIE
jgi:hypothetical protein